MKTCLPKNFYIPVVFFLITFCADAAITTYGLSLGASEGNEIVVWLWSIFGTDSVILKILYIGLVIGGAYLLCKRNYWLGLWTIYAFAFGHLFGFLTWVSPLYTGTVRLIISAMIISLLAVWMISKKFKN